MGAGCLRRGLGCGGCFLWCHCCSSGSRLCRLIVERACDSNDFALRYEVVVVQIYSVNKRRNVWGAREESGRTLFMSGGRDYLIHRSTACPAAYTLVLFRAASSHWLQYFSSAVFCNLAVRFSDAFAVLLPSVHNYQLWNRPGSLGPDVRVLPS